MKWIKDTVAIIGTLILLLAMLALVVLSILSEFGFRWGPAFS